MSSSRRMPLCHQVCVEALIRFFRSRFSFQWIWLKAIHDYLPSGRRGTACEAYRSSKGQIKWGILLAWPAGVEMLKPLTLGKQPPRCTNRWSGRSSNHCTSHRHTFRRPPRRRTAPRWRGNVIPHHTFCRNCTLCLLCSPHSKSSGGAATPRRSTLPLELSGTLILPGTSRFPSSVASLCICHRCICPPPDGVNTATPTPRSAQVERSIDAMARRRVDLLASAAEFLIIASSSDIMVFDGEMSASTDAEAFSQ